MTTFYTFNTLVDPDQGADTDIRPFGQFYQATDTSYQCYNALFGKGNYDGCDPSLELNLEHQDNANTTIVLDSSDNGRHGYLKDQNGTLGGEYSGGTTSDLSYEDGPTGYLPRSLHLLSTASSYDPGEIAFGVNTSTKLDWADIPESQGITMIGWGHMNGSRSYYQFFRRLANGNPLAGSVYAADIHVGPNHDPYSQARLFTGGTNYGSYLTYRPPSPFFDPNTWYHYAYTIKDLNRTIFVNGEEKLTTTSGQSMSYAMDAGFYAGYNGRQAGKALFSRELSDAEIQEAYSGPEPYAQLAPSISGTPAVGDFVTINAGTWNSQNNGVIRYSYKMYSYSDTNGSDERLEKEITSYKVAQKILIRGSRLVGRYLRFIVSAENDGGTDPLEVYETGYTAAITSGTDPSYVSYNALFGYGKHVPDPELQTRMLFDEDPTGDGFNQYGDWTITGNTLTDAALTEDGPTTYLSKSFQFPNTAPVMTVQAGKQDIIQFSWTFGGWIKQYGVGPAGVGGMMLLGSSNVNVAMRNSFTNMRFITRWFPTLQFNWVNDVGYGNWHHLVGRHVNSSGISPAYQNADEAELFLNGQSKAYTNANNGNWTPDLYTGDVGGYLDGHLADFWWIERDLSDDEIAETYTGPEPVNITAPSIFGDFRVGFVITANAGTWDNQNNGSVTTAYQWYRADDANGTNLTAIAGATGSTYELSFDDHQKYVTVRERASNDGGYDELEDAFSTYSSEIGLKGGMLVVKAG